MKAKRTFRRETFTETTLLAFVCGANVKDAETCSICAEHPPMFAPELIAEVLPVSAREIYRLVEANEIHFVEREKVFVCLKSLLNRENKK